LVACIFQLDSCVVVVIVVFALYYSERWVIWSRTNIMILIVWHAEWIFDLEMITYNETKKRTENNSDIVGGTFDRGRLFFNVSVWTDHTTTLLWKSLFLSVFSPSS
jgi:hypothetical protein